MLLLYLGCSFVSADIIIKGSDTLGAKMVPQLVEAYKKLYPKSEFEITAEGSSTCFTALLEGTCDIGMASRLVKARELSFFQDKGLVLQEHVVAYDIIAVVVNEKNPIHQLTLKQVEQIFTGKITSWKELGAKGVINVYTRNTSSGTYKTFQKLAMRGKDYGKNTQKIGGSFHPIIAPDNQSIGYCGLAYAKTKGIRPLKINKVEPVAQNAQSYPLSRNLYFYTVGELRDDTKLFVEWVKKSSESHKIIESVGFAPLQIKDVEKIVR